MLYDTLAGRITAGAYSKEEGGRRETGRESRTEAALLMVDQRGLLGQNKSPTMENARDPGQSYLTRPIQVKSSQGGADGIRIMAEAGKKDRRGGVFSNRRERN